MPWKPGQSGNPKGRPPASRALTEILRKAGNRRIPHNGMPKKRGRKYILADLIWQAVTLGEVTFPDGSTLEIKGQAWLQVLQWLYRHIDGDAPQHVKMEDISDYAAAAAAVRDAILNGNGDPSSSE